MKTLVCREDERLTTERSELFAKVAVQYSRASADSGEPLILGASVSGSSSSQEDSASSVALEFTFITSWRKTKS